MSVDYTAMTVYGFKIEDGTYGDFWEAVEDNDCEGEGYLFCADEMNGEGAFFAVETGRELDWGEWREMTDADLAHPFDDDESHRQFLDLALKYGVPEGFEPKHYYVMRVS